MYEARLVLREMLGFVNSESARLAQVLLAAAALAGVVVWSLLRDAAAGRE